jgi:hypothetical protein
VQVEAFFFFSVLDPSGLSLILLNSDPRTRKGARLRAGSPQEVWSPAAREEAAVKRWRRTVRCGAVFPSGEREGEREALKLDLRGLTSVKGNGGFTLGKKNILRRCLIPFNSPSVETER